MVVDVLTEGLCEVEVDLASLHDVELLGCEHSHPHGCHKEEVDWLQSNISDTHFLLFLKAPLANFLMTPLYSSKTKNEMNGPSRKMIII